MAPDEEVKTGWQPIESAPWNAKWWLVWAPVYDGPVVSRCRGSDGSFWEGDWEYDLKPTHWMPVLPDRPEAR